jgi:hypothetical protein
MVGAFCSPGNRYCPLPLTMRISSATRSVAMTLANYWTDPTDIMHLKSQNEKSFSAYPIC